MMGSEGSEGSEGSDGSDGSQQQFISTITITIIITITIMNKSHSPQSDWRLTGGGRIDRDRA
jgi:hypothetical protein